MYCNICKTPMWGFSFDHYRVGRLYCECSFKTEEQPVLESVQPSIQDALAYERARQESPGYWDESDTTNMWGHHEQDTHEPGEPEEELPF